MLIVIALRYGEVNLAFGSAQYFSNIVLVCWCAYSGYMKSNTIPLISAFAEIITLSFLFSSKCVDQVNSSEIKMRDRFSQRSNLRNGFKTFRTNLFNKIRGGARVANTAGCAEMLAGYGRIVLEWENSEHDKRISWKITYFTISQLPFRISNLIIIQYYELTLTIIIM